MSCTQPWKPETAEVSQVEALAGPSQLARGQLLGLAQRLVDGREHRVGKDLHVVGVDRRGVDLDRLELERPRDRGRHHAAAGGGFDDLVLELLLRHGHRLLQPL